MRLERPKKSIKGYNRVLGIKKWAKSLDKRRIDAFVAAAACNCSCTQSSASSKPVDE